MIVNQQAFAGKVGGVITDEKNEPLPYAIVYVAGTSIGTTANGEGIYSLDLKDSTYEISFRIIGYKLVTKQVKVGGSPVELNISLSPESVS